MFVDLLDYIIQKKVFAEIKGITMAGTEKILEHHEDGICYRQKNVVFTAMMVDSILFHQKGCTIVLKH
jgi:hypothetical protein